MLFHRWFDHPRRFTQPQRFAAELRAVVKNTGTAEKHCTLILPRPAQTHSQQLSDMVSRPSEALIGHEDRFGQDFFAWPVALKSGEEKILAVHFRLETRPHVVEFAPALTLSDYRTPDARYLAPNRFLSPDDPGIQTVAQGLVGRSQKVMDIIAEANSYVMQKLVYGDPIDGLYTTRDALTRERVDCGGFDVLLGSILMACGIPVRLACGFFAGYKKNTMHAWLEILLPDGQWMGADPSLEQLRSLGQTKKSGALNHLGSDRVLLSYGCDLTLSFDRNTIAAAILQNSILFPADSEVAVRTEFLTKSL